MFENVMINLRIMLVLYVAIVVAAAMICWSLYGRNMFNRACCCQDPHVKGGISRKEVDKVRDVCAEYVACLSCLAYLRVKTIMPVH